MIIVDDCIISDNLADVRFSCDLEKCKGACCVEGDCGAPLEKEEIAVLERIYPEVKPYMTPEGVAVVESEGVSSLDVDKLPCTPLVNNRECAYSVECEGKTLCAIEMAWREGKIDYPKPISCHLYPVRIEDYGEFKAVNYHEWDVCRCALAKGKEAGGRPLYEYLEVPLLRRFGRAWYEELCEQCRNRK
ncbi:MAG: DUF3109 family protein [Bacteroidales bacterium]|nr:DUF3109 family protein [Bacteroidales bacterium]